MGGDFSLSRQKLNTIPKEKTNHENIIQHIHLPGIHMGANARHRVRLEL
jgi:hypothetical protein